MFEPFNFQVVMFLGVISVVMHIGLVLFLYIIIYYIEKDLLGILWQPKEFWCIYSCKYWFANVYCNSIVKQC